MSSYYRKLRQHILSCQDFQSLNECFDMVYNAWNVNDIENIRGLDDDNHKLKSDYEIAKNGRFA